MIPVMLSDGRLIRPDPSRKCPVCEDEGRVWIVRVPLPPTRPDAAVAWAVDCPHCEATQGLLRTLDGGPR